MPQVKELTEDLRKAENNVASLKEQINALIPESLKNLRAAEAERDKLKAMAADVDFKSYIDDSSDQNKEIRISGVRKRNISLLKQKSVLEEEIGKENSVLELKKGELEKLKEEVRNLEVKVNSLGENLLKKKEELNEKETSLKDSLNSVENSYTLWVSARGNERKLQEEYNRIQVEIEKLLKTLKVAKEDLLVLKDDAHKKKQAEVDSLEKKHKELVDASKILTTLSIPAATHKINFTQKELKKDLDDRISFFKEKNNEISFLLEQLNETLIILEEKSKSLKKSTVDYKVQESLVSQKVNTLEQYKIELKSLEGILKKIAEYDIVLGQVKEKEAEIKHLKAAVETEKQDDSSVFDELDTLEVQVQELEAKIKTLKEDINIGRKKEAEENKKKKPNFPPPPPPPTGNIDPNEPVKDNEDNNVISIAPPLSIDKIEGSVHTFNSADDAAFIQKPIKIIENKSEGSLNKLKNVCSGCFCNVWDVIMEGGFEDNFEHLIVKIEYKIRNVSEYIRQISDVSVTSERYAFYTKMACIYGVLVWLESKNMILNSSNIVSLHEGNVSVNYRSNDSIGQFRSYSEHYDYYLNFLLGTPPVGA